MAKKEIYKDGLEEYPISVVIRSNFLMLVWLFLGAYLCAGLHLYAGLGYLIISFAMVFVVMRKLVCTNCWYYGKWCGAGWGKLSALMFKQGDIENFAECTGTKIAPMFYGLLSLIPLIVGMIVIITSSKGRIFHIAAWLFLLGFSFYSGTIAREKGCRQCKMRYICPGSAAK